ncbi:hypothetical protein ACEZCY_30545 [Streptacidiphilus sp. N1-12]|uniref:Uncharacterized protein n=2 Tax=Streptacidiphilus alkalitolerans TaxID=3342712 RepID=A0ABV6WT06_9ACTN
MAKLCAALTAGAAASALALLVLAPAGAASAAAPVVPGGGGATGGGVALVTTDVAGPAAAAAAAANAARSGLETISVDPGTSRPGGAVDLRTFADCGGAQGGTVSSSAFAAPVSLALAADGGLYAEADVVRKVSPGTYAVRELCDGKAVAAGTLKVVAPVAPDTGGGWGATRAGADALGGASGRSALALTGAAALGGLVLLGNRLRGSFSGSVSARRDGRG